ncbi:hypothetical protein [Amphritea sp. HPY]|uniref:hypothetical protein n=1 Tax=Amphritea sp. HPY TaxID=3421652 RepID=UPI003D7EB2A8
MIIRSTWVLLSAVTVESDIITAITIERLVIGNINAAAMITGIPTQVIKSTVIETTAISMTIMLFTHVFTETGSRDIKGAIAQAITELRMEYVMTIDCTDIDGITTIGDHRLG